MTINISASILIILIVTIRALTLNYLPKKTFMYLWNIVILRLVVFFYIPLPFFKPTGFTFNESLVNKYPVPLKYVWIIGTMFTFLTIIFLHIKSCLEYRFALPSENAHINQWLIEHPLKRPIQVKTFDKISSAMTYGILKPIILLPTSMNLKEEENLDLVLAHEYIHIKYYHLVIKYLLVIILSIYWFNPIIWLLYVFANRDIELCCDEEVIKMFGVDKNAAYARILLKIEVQRGAFVSPINYIGKNALEERIVYLMKPKHHTKSTLIISICIIILLIFAGFTTLSHKNKVLSNLNNSQNIIVHDDSEVEEPNYVDNFGAAYSLNPDQDYDLSYS